METSRKKEADTKMECVLQTKELCKQYRHGRALNGLTASVPKGSIYGLIGKNGAGKTTLIRILCGLQRPSAGSFTLFGAAGGPEMARARRRMGAMVETPSLYPDRTAAGNLALQNRVLGLAGRRQYPGTAAIGGAGEHRFQTGARLFAGNAPAAGNCTGPLWFPGFSCSG